jgi:hypothetical protein
MPLVGEDLWTVWMAVPLPTAQVPSSKCYAQKGRVPDDLE